MNQPAASLMAGMRQRIQQHTPFDRMDPLHVDRLIAVSRLQYFSPGEIMLTPEQGVADFCLLIRQGRVRGERPDATGGQATASELAEGEMFPIGALLSDRPAVSVYRAVGDVFCLRIARSDFHWLLENSFVFKDFCARRLTHLLEVSRQRMQADYVAEASSQQGMESPLASLLRREPVTCTAQTAVGIAAQTMVDERVGSMIVIDAAQRPLGMLTRTDLVGKALLPQASMSTPVAALMTSPVLCLPSSASAGDAVLLMASHGIQHVAVTDHERLVGVVSERDLFGLQRLSLRHVSEAVRHARSLKDLFAAAGLIRELSRGQVVQGVAAVQLTHFISSLNDQLTIRAIELVAQQVGMPQGSWCWIAMGSEGRHEQTISTDQDNGIIFDSAGGDVDAQRAELMAFALQINEALRDCGFPLCPGGIMASNAKCCLSLQEWRQRFANWIDQGDPQALLNASIFFDFRPIHGDQRLAYTLREHILLLVRENSRFLKQMSDNALSNRPPVSWLDSLLETDRRVDLKRYGAMPFVDAARIFALAAGVDATSTIERIRQSEATLRLDPASVQAWLDAFQFVQRLRLRNQHLHDGSGEHGSANKLDPQSLSAIDQRILKEAFRQARLIQQRLSLSYPG